MSRRPTLPNLRVVVYSVLLLVAVSGGVSNVFLARETSQIQHELTLVNTTGRQRMLAEQVARHAWQLVTALATVERHQARLRLQRSVTEMHQGHETLTAALTSISVAAPTPSRPFLPRLNTEVEGYLAAARSILLTPDAQLARRNADIRWLEQQATGPLIAVLDEANAAMERRSAQHARRITTLTWFRLLFILSLLMVLALVEFRPLEKRIRRVQDELIRERDFAQQVMTTVAQGLSVTDAQGRFEYVNPAYAQLLNVSPESLLGRTPFDVTFEDDHATLALARSQREGGQTSAYETRLKRADGTAVPVLITGAPRVAGNLHSGTIAAITDLTEQKRNEQTVRTLAALSHSLEQERTPAAVAERALNVLSEAMELAWLVLYIRDGDRFRPIAFSGTMPAGLRDRMELGVSRGEGRIWDTLTGQAVYLEESRIPAYVALGVKSVALVPLPASDGGVTQVLCAYRGGDPRPWTTQEQVLLEAAARSMSAALERAELHQRAQEVAEYTQTLLAVSALVESAFEPSAMAQQVLRLLAPTLKLDRGSVLLVRRDQIEAVTAWNQGLTAQDIQEQLGPSDRQVLREQIRQVLQSGQPVYIDDYPAQLDASSRLVAGGLRSVAWVPLAALHDTHYLFVVTRLHQARAWSQRDQELLAAAARTIRVAFERQAYLQLVEQASLTDPLTGLGNRRALDRVLEELTAGPDERFALLSIDVDGLKQINDTLGHEWGDLLLREFGQALRMSVRLQDQVFRLGGDEFVVVLPGCQPAQAQEILSRVQLAAERIRRRPELQACGASAGLAFRPEDGQTPAGLMNRADERMYQDKRQRKQGGAFH